MSLTNGVGMVAYTLRWATIGGRSTHRVYGQPLGAADVPNNFDGCDGGGTSVAAAVRHDQLVVLLVLVGRKRYLVSFLSRN